MNERDELRKAALIADIHTAMDGPKWTLSTAFKLARRAVRLGLIVDFNCGWSVDRQRWTVHLSRVAHSHTGYVHIDGDQPALLLLTALEGVLDPDPTAPAWQGWFRR